MIRYFFLSKVPNCYQKPDPGPGTAHPKNILVHEFSKIETICNDLKPHRSLRSKKNKLVASDNSSSILQILVWGMDCNSYLNWLFLIIWQDCTATVSFQKLMPRVKLPVLISTVYIAGIRQLTFPIWKQLGTELKGLTYGSTPIIISGLISRFHQYPDQTRENCQGDK